MLGCGDLGSTPGNVTWTVRNTALRPVAVWVQGGVSHGQHRAWSSKCLVHRRLISTPLPSPYLFPLCFDVMADIITGPFPTWQSSCILCLWSSLGRWAALIHSFPALVLAAHATQKVGQGAPGENQAAKALHLHQGPQSCHALSGPLVQPRHSPFLPRF